MVIPTHDYRRSGFRAPADPLKGIDAWVNSVIGRCRRRSHLRETLLRDAFAVDAMAPEWIELPDGKLHFRLAEFRTIFRRGGASAGEFVLPALAAIREAADRQLGLRPFPVQLMAALALHRGYLAEMATGEGKTLVAGLAAVLAGWTKRPCHVITVNDYLVERDAGRLRPLFDFCGVSVGAVTGAMDAQARKAGYGSDVTYTTSKELLADFLRDRIRLGSLQNPIRRTIRRMLAPGSFAQDGLVLRGLHTAIVDEADSVLIDEAVTPLIISAPRENALLKEAALIAEEVSAGLCPDSDYQTNARYKEVDLTESGFQRISERAMSLPGLWQGKERRQELVVQALVAREFFKRDKHYIIVDGKVVIVDEFTGRPMPQRTWSQGVHQAIEAKERLAVSDPTETISRLSFQRFFRCFYNLSGMTGTAYEAAGEFWQVYGLPVVSVPTNRPCIRAHWPDRVFLSEAGKWEAIVTEIERLHASRRPVLVGTRSVLASEHLAELIAARGLQAKVINATHLADEAAVVSMAGEAGRITIATNMAGRGTDVILGQGVAKLGGLHVIATERHESGRVDRQLFGRSARQGDPGSAQAFVSAEDELVRRYVPSVILRCLKAALHEERPWRGPLARATFSLAQRNAQALAFKQRVAVLRADIWLNEALSFAPGEGI